jgi:hypothetical protein
MSEFEYLALHLEMLLVSSNVQPVIIVVYVLVAVMHIVSGLSLRDCSQLLFSLKLLINLMVEDFRTTMVRVNSWKNLSPQMPAPSSTGLPCSHLVESLSAVLNALPVIQMMGQTPTLNFVRQKIP